jgi:hypothetical protein
MVQAVIQTTVTGLQGNPVAAGTPGGNQSLTWNGTTWAPAGPFMSSTGGTFTGPITLSANAAQPLQPVSLQQLQGGYLPLVGGSLSGNLNLASLFASSTVTGQSGVSAPGGNVSAGTAGVSGGSLVGRGAGSSLQLYDSNGGNFYWGVSSLNGTFTMSNSNTFGCFQMDMSGNLTILGALTQGSDETNKTAITALAQGISLIRQLIPKSFAWSYAPTVIHWGFIAQDVQSVIPEAVSQGPESPTGAPGLLGVDFTAVLAAVTFAVKQLDERCAALEAHDGITPPAAQLA